MKNLTDPFVAYWQYARAHIARLADRSEKGAAMVEYALLVALIAAVCIGVLAALGGSIKGLFGTVSNNVSNLPAAG